VNTGTAFWEFARESVNKFWDLLRESVIIQGTITLGIIGAVVYLAVTAQPIPEIVEKLSLLIVGYFMGAKPAAQINKVVRDLAKTMTQEKEKRD